jgi:arginyl-tRNA synthetase
LKQIISDLIAQALRELEQTSQIPSELNANIQVTPARDPGQGDYASNVALTLAKPAGMSPRALAEMIVGKLPTIDTIEKVEVAGPGFINFFVASATSHSIIRRILEQGNDFGRSLLGEGNKIQVEFVSANPTGPLHVGHGRGAAIGATLANLLSFVGYEVQQEYWCGYGTWSSAARPLPFRVMATRVTTSGILRQRCIAKTGRVFKNRWQK